MKKGMKTTISINHQPSGGREWVAEITGRDQRYGVARKFLVAIDASWSSSGKTGSTIFELEAGKLYQVKPSWKDRYYLAFQDGETWTPTTQEVQQALDRLDAGQIAFPQREEIHEPHEPDDQGEVASTTNGKTPT